MNFQLKCRNHADCPDEVKQAIADKTERFATLIPETAYFEIELLHYARVQNNGDKEARVILDIPGVTPVIRFAAQGTTFLEAVDRALDKLDGELSDQKHRQTDYSLHHNEPTKMKVADMINREEL